MEPPGEQSAQEVIKQRTLQVDVCPQEATGMSHCKGPFKWVCVCRRATGCLSLRTLSGGCVSAGGPGCLPLRMPVGQQLGQGLLPSLAVCACFTRLSAEGRCPCLGSASVPLARELSPTPHCLFWNLLL